MRNTSRKTVGRRLTAVSLGSLLLVSLTGINPALAVNGGSLWSAPADGAVCPIEPGGGSEIEIAQTYLGDGFVDGSYVDGHLVLGVYGLNPDAIAGLAACWEGATVVARPVSLSALRAAQSLVVDRLPGLVNTAEADYARGTVIATVSSGSLDGAVALAEADPVLSVMLATEPSTPDKVRLDLVEGPESTIPIGRVAAIAVTPKEVKAGGTVQVGLTNLVPSAVVVVVLRPAGTDLATWTADQNGVIRSSVTLPTGLAAGDYVLAFFQRVTGVSDFELGAVAIKVTGTASSVPRSSTDLPPTGSRGGLALAVLLGAAGVGAAVWRRRAVP
jgi:hypothetical protein